MQQQQEMGDFQRNAQQQPSQVFGDFNIQNSISMSFVASMSRFG